jgi:hypothetical protein
MGDLSHPSLFGKENTNALNTLLAYQRSMLDKNRFYKSQNAVMESKRGVPKRGKALNPL